MSKKIFYWQLIGVIFSTTLGCILHFAYEWSGFYKPLAIFAAVNESVWEHLKIGFWPTFLFAIIEYPFIKHKSNNFFIGKALSLFLIPLLITTIFYTYTGIIGHHYLLVDILTFYVSIILAEYICYRVILSYPRPIYCTVIAIIFIILLVVVFSSLTFNPISIPLFMDPRTNSSGT
ncbi:hypothetical protein CPJCM30710_02660 [Clostridium polyendosporum]|uniref:Uncharacterized protein n=1 Tax=Clostridium polyendosporum TaxID=69208 RepID=A0A919VEN3_9CLOT|nr:DUF6512 family protein [Clostridium polyendosporum]GIM27600.1 hypothetical protein CPJCM30710_02660 [Clostridium polyendosporum]